LDFILRILDSPAEMTEVEDLQRQVWSGNETEVVPAHMLIAAVQNGGLLIGAFHGEQWQASSELVGFVFGFPGLYFTPDGPRPKHCSHMLAVRPDYQDKGAGFSLKRAQWQMVRHQGIDRITWTYDPLLSRNARLNIGKLGSVCSTYFRDVYGELRDDLNAGLPTDRFQVDWWVNSQRVNHRLSKRARPQLDLAHYIAAGVEIINPTRSNPAGWPQPGLPRPTSSSIDAGRERAALENALLLVEIPSDFLALKAADPALALEWRLHTRALFEDLFTQGYLVTDFVLLTGPQSRSFYVLSHGDSTL
jgi:predicted GNAT superfamily acetyltransferase